MSVPTTTARTASRVGTHRRDPQPRVAILRGSQLVRSRVSPLLMIAAAASWIVALATKDASHPSPFGLTATMGPLFVLAVVLNCVAFAAELYGAGRRLVLGASVALLTLVLKATVPILERMPEYDWTYKHFGVVSVLAANGHVVDPKDIYQEWPAFFALFAQLQSVTGVSLERAGAWSSCFFTSVDAVILYACFRRLGASTRTSFAAIFLMEAFAWPDTNYFSPQAFAFALSLGVLLMILTWMVPSGDQRPIRGNFLARWLIRRSGGWPLAQGPSRSTSVAWWPVILTCGAFFVLTAAHQLSPYVLVATVIGLTLFDLVRPRWLAAAFLAIAIGYFLPHLGAVTSQFKIFDGFNVFANASGNGVVAPGSPEQRLSVLCARILSFGLWGGAFAVVVALRKRPRAIAVPVILGLSPFAILVFGNYGGEAIYRVILFSSPWFSLLVARVAARAPRRRDQATLVCGLVLAAVCLTSLQSIQGELSFNVVTTSEVQASRYFYEHAPRGSSLTLAAQAFPTRLTANYNDFNQKFTTDPSLLTDPKLVDRTWDAAVLPEVDRQVRSNGGTHQFLVVSSRMKPYVEYWGLLDPASLDTFERTLSSSGDWQLWYHNDDTRIYELRSGTTVVQPPRSPSQDPPAHDAPPAVTSRPQPSATPLLPRATPEPLDQVNR